MVFRDILGDPCHSRAIISPASRTSKSSARCPSCLPMRVNREPRWNATFMVPKVVPYAISWSRRKTTNDARLRRGLVSGDDTADHLPLTSVRRHRSVLKLCQAVQISGPPDRRPFAAAFFRRAPFDRSARIVEREPAIEAGTPSANARSGLPTGGCRPRAVARIVTSRQQPEAHAPTSCVQVPVLVRTLSQSPGKSRGRGQERRAVTHSCPTRKRKRT